MVVAGGFTLFFFLNKKEKEIKKILLLTLIGDEREKGVQRNCYLTFKEE